MLPPDGKLRRVSKVNNTLQYLNCLLMYVPIDDTKEKVIFFGAYCCLQEAPNIESFLEIGNF